MKVRLLLLVLLPLSLGVGVTGCGEATHLVYVHSASLGVQVTPVVQPGGTAKFVIGYDRETFALIPRNGKAEDGADAMSLTAISQVKVDGLDEVQFGHLIATGAAASRVLTDPETITKSAKTIFGE